MNNESCNSMQQLVGRRIKRHIFNRFGALVLPAMTVLEPKHLNNKMVQEIGLTQEDVFPNETDGIRKQVVDAISEIRDIMYQARYSHMIPLIDVRSRVIPSIMRAAGQMEIVSLLHEMQAKDDYTFRHTIGTGIIATLIGRWLRVDEPDLNELTIAATLHDIGKVTVPDVILNKSGPLSPAEYELIKKHTVNGYEMLRRTPGITHRQALVALQHHEREDGSGYPFGVTGNRLDLFTKIVSVADVFHAMISHRPYRKAVPYYQMVEEMRLEQFGKLDPAITDLFLNKITFSLIGRETVLTDGRKGKVVMANPQYPARPLVKVDDVFIDLSKQEQLRMEQVL